MDRRNGSVYAQNNADAFDQLALASRVEEITGEIRRHGRAIQLMGGDREQAIVGEGHEAAAMDVSGAVEVLFLDPERRADAAVVLDLVPERADMALKTVANPGSPALELALGGDVQVGAAGRGRFGQFVQGNGPSITGLLPLNPIRRRVAIPVPADPACKTWDSGKMHHKGLFGSP